MIRKIISGGQTGADRSALDVALKLEIPHGGWIPKGRLAEDGPLCEACIIHKRALQRLRQVFRFQFRFRVKETLL